ncbi:MAG: hypothetical protein QXX77_09690 [Candidatus Methanosuratincola sp.]
MDDLIKRIREAIENCEKIELVEAVVPPLMEVRLKEKSVFFTSNSGRSENPVYSGKDFIEAYRRLSEAVLRGDGVFERNIGEPHISYLRSYCREYLEKSK